MTAAHTLLASGWSQPLTRDQSVVYVEMLADIPDDELLQAVRFLIATEVWRPPVAVIRRRVLAARGVLIDEATATAQFDALSDWEIERESAPLGAQAARPPRPDAHPTVLEAWRAAGSDAPLGVFLKVWRTAHERSVGALLAASLAAPPALGPGGEA